MRFICIFFFLPFAFRSQTLQVKNPLRFLALGDSYTIGQSVAVTERWPVQLSDSLATRGFVTDTLTIIATTGWRTDDLLNAITGQDLRSKNYNLVSVLIGVNNQYQNKPFSQYQIEFPALLDSAIAYAGGDTSAVFVVSIPDYAYTPFGQQSPNPSQISADLDQYNLFNKQVADSFKIRYFDITPISRQGLNSPSYVAGDGLHPSGAQYARWVRLMLAGIQNVATAIKTNKDNEEIEFGIFPNPSKELITVSFNATANAQTNLTLYDVAGYEVLKQQLISEQSVINVDGLAAGMYLCKVTTNKGAGFKKFIILD